MKIEKVGWVVILDPDGDEITRGGWTYADELARTLDVAMKKWVPRDVPWSETMPDRLEKPIVAVWMDDKSGSQQMMKMLQDPWIAKLHGTFTWIKIDAEKAKNWKAMSAPALFVLGRDETILERVAGVRSIGGVHEALASALKKFKK